MKSKLISFEIHLTVAPLTEAETAQFVAICLDNEAKAILIELAQGESKNQPMFTKVVYAKTIIEALAMANKCADLLNKTFKVTRIKMEIPSKFDYLFLNKRQVNFDNYYEWHGKVIYDKIDDLNILCNKNKVHLSHNSLKNEADRRFITLREFGTNAIFTQRINDLVTDLENGNWQLLSQHFEYCVYDNNTVLDAGWLPQ
jgi:hypothetical protein